MAKMFLSYITMCITTQDELPDTKTIVDTLIWVFYITKYVKVKDVTIYPYNDIMAQGMTIVL